ncbi:MAG: DNA/RNA non-specific endonuclease [Bacteroidaceae bacterium]|nr:DNA/RNA non-specific endonuclease [Bacteroidaceae bacterium]
MRMKKIFIYILILLSVACSHDDGPLNPDEEPAVNPENINANNHGGYSTRIEIPRIQEGDIFVSHCTTVKKKENITYSLAQCPQRKHSRWTAFTFDASNRNISWSRGDWDHTEWHGDPFQADPELPSNCVMTKQEINGNGFVRGHLVASYDRVYSKDANEQTFYYSNMSPMRSRFNTGRWSDLEGMVQNWGRDEDFCDTLYIVKGGTINQGFYESKGTCPTVPKYYFMALLCRMNDKFKAIGFWFEHKDYLSGSVKSYSMSIDELEEKSGIDFFCNLPDNVEEKVEKRHYPDQWKGL